MPTNYEKYKEYYKEYHKKYREKNKERIKENKKLYYEQNKHISRNSSLKLKFGISLEEYNSLLEKQSNKCVICKKEYSSDKPLFAVDHNHTTGKIRGILCGQCNTALGLVKENEFILLEMIKYVKER